MKNMLTPIFLLILVPSLVAERTIFWNSKKHETMEENMIKRLYTGVCNNKDSVSFNNMSLSYIPQNSISSEHIKAVSLAKNNLLSLPMHIFDTAPNIECMDLTQNNILNYVNPSTFKYESLKTLILNGQRIPCTPISSLRKYFPNLEILQLNGFYRTSCPMNFSEFFPRLHTLHLAQNNLHAEDSVFSTLPLSLQNLHLEDNNIYSFPRYHLENLRELYLDGNFIGLPIVLPDNSNLRILSLSRCNLSERFKMIINSSSLEVLDISNNMLQHVNKHHFEFMPNLRYLLLHGNMLTEVPNMQYLWQLESLDLSYNLIEDVGEMTIPFLKHLSLNGNKISLIQKESFSQLSQLQTLDLSNNKLRYLPVGWSNELTRLNSLNLRNNQFSSIADMSIAFSFDFRDLYVQDNAITSIDEKSLMMLPENCNIHVAYKQTTSDNCVTK